MQVKTVKGNKTVGSLEYRDRLGHLWVAEMLLNVQSTQIKDRNKMKQYTLPYGQMSFWGITVITSQISVVPWIGTDILHQIWGGMSIDNATQNRLFSLHFQMPFVITALVVAHFMALHEHGSNNPMGISGKSNRIPFHVYFTSKDLVGLFVAVQLMAYFIFWDPNYLGQWMAQEKLVEKLVGIPTNNRN